MYAAAQIDVKRYTRTSFDDDSARLMSLMSLIFYLYTRLSLPTSSSPAVGVYGFLLSQDLGGVAMHV
jgi:hypothetical protein